MSKKLIPKKVQKNFRSVVGQIVDDLSEPLGIIQESPMFIDCPNCFEAGTLVETPYGLKTIESFEPGDLILDGFSEPRLVDKVFSRHTNTDFTTIKTHGNNIGITATSNHKMVVAENLGTPYNPVLGQSSEKSIGEIRSGDLVYKSIRVLPDQPLEKLFVNWKVNNPGPKKLLSEVLEVSDDFLFALGLYIAEGVTNKGRIVSYCLNDDEKHLGRKVCAFWKNVVDANHSEQDRPNSKNRVFEIYSSYLADLLDRWCGHGAENKQIPSSLYYRLDREQTMVLLFGLFVGDGHYEKEYGSVVLSTVSKTLAYQVYTLLLSCGYSASILSQPSKVGKDGIQRKECFTVRYWPDEKFVQRGTIRTDDKVFQVVKSVDFHRKETEVYNLEVQTEHSYIADGFSVKNCIWDSINKKSSNIFDSSFISSAIIFASTDQERTISPISFTSGRCPVCIGEGQLFTSQEVCIRAMINFLSPRDARADGFTNLPAGREAANTILVKALPCHYELLLNNSVFILHNGVKCHKVKAPYLRGLGGVEAVVEVWLQTSEVGERTSFKMGNNAISADTDPRKKIKGPTDINIRRGRLTGR